MLTSRDSYIVYIVLIAGYLVLILFFFPETRYDYHPFYFSNRRVIILTSTPHRNMTIEEVSVLFDTGRKGDAQAAALTFSHGKDIELTEAVNDEEAERQGKRTTVSHVELSDHK